MPKSHRPYTPEFRRQMVDLVRSGRTPEALSREFGAGRPGDLELGCDRPIALWVSRYTGCVKNVTSAATGLIALQFSRKAVPKFSDVGVIWAQP